jgi:hypothetical protein
MGWMAKDDIFKLPAERDSWYRFIYNRVRGNKSFVDYQTIGKGGVDWRETLEIH